MPRTSKVPKDHWLCECGVRNHIDRIHCLGCNKVVPKKPRLVKDESPYLVGKSLHLDPLL